ncbi:MAG TPA: VOC family protein [Gammaproteobacteria bacterium]|nr:VOC family protein [Gammaproteobacteria bacterium]
MRIPMLSFRQTVGGALRAPAAAALLRRVAATFLALVAAAPVAVFAQTITAQGPVVYGHHHFNTTDMAAQKRFYVDTLGGKLAKIGKNDLEVIEFPNVFLFFRPMQQPTGGTIGSTVNHIGFSVRDLPPVVAMIKANGFKMITSDSVAATVKVTDDIAAVSPTTNIAFVLGPDDVKVELVEVKTQRAPIQLHHVHFFGEHPAEMQAWYAKTFGAAAQPQAPGQAFVTAQLPGVTLSFSPSESPTVGTQGRALDHIGFEVKNLEAFTKKLEADGIPLTVSYRPVPALGISIAFIKDPWGTNIELTEGLAGID